jgi:hypothetical protein
MGEVECTALTLKKNVMIWLMQLVEAKALNMMEASYYSFHSVHEPILAFHKCCTHPTKCTNLQILQKPITKLHMGCWSTFQQTKISMCSIQICDALNILFKLEKLHVEHLKGFILLSKEGGELHNFFRTKVGASMVGGMFGVVIMSY